MPDALDDAHGADDADAVLEALQLRQAAPVAARTRLAQRRTPPPSAVQAETLAVVAYPPPVSRSDISRIR
jgi:chromosome segregation and condensation protein ScpB